MFGNKAAAWSHGLILLSKVNIVKILHRAARLYEGL